MGSSASPSVSLPRAETRADHQRYMRCLRSCVPAWAAAHQEFETVADEELARALRSFDVAKGVPFQKYLKIVGSRRIPDRLLRETRGAVGESRDTTLSQRRPLRSLEEALAADPELVMDSLHQPDASSERGYELIDSTDRLGRFLGSLTRTERVVAECLAQGLLPSEIAQSLGVGRSAVSNAIARVRPKAAAYWADVVDAPSPVVLKAA